MTRITWEDYLDNEFERHAGRRQLRSQLGPSRRMAPRKSDHAMLDEILQYADAPVIAGNAAFTPTFSSSRHERTWILTYLGPFYEDKKITDVLRKVRGGKEANVYCCAGHPDTGLELIAAKVYRPRMLRNLRNDARYRQGRTVLDSRGKPVRDRRALVALRQGSRVGQEIRHTSWLSHEFEALRVLYAAGVHVPQPLVQGHNTILMGYVGDRDRPAPALNAVRLRAAEARGLFQSLMEDVQRMLEAGRVHGDLSAYNVLFWQGEYAVIDFPQAIDPETHPEGFAIFERDVRRLCQYFARYGIETDAGELAAGWWAEQGLPREKYDSPPVE